MRRTSAKHKPPNARRKRKAERVRRKRKAGPLRRKLKVRNATPRSRTPAPGSRLSCPISEPDQVLPPSPEGGRPSAWETRIKPRMDRVRKLATAGASDAEIMAALKVSRSAFYRTLREQEEFSDALDTAREPATDEVQSALFKLATGYDSEVVREESEDGKPERTVVTRQRAPPSLAAARFWLVNRRPELWRDRGVLGAGPGAFDAVPYSDNVPDPQPLPPHLLPPGRNDGQGQRVQAAPETAGAARVAGE